MGIRMKNQYVRKWVIGFLLLVAPYVWAVRVYQIQIVGNQVIQKKRFKLN